MSQALIDSSDSAQFRTWSGLGSPDGKSVTDGLDMAVAVFACVFWCVVAIVYDWRDGARCVLGSETEPPPPNSRQPVRMSRGREKALFCCSDRASRVPGDYPKRNHKHADHDTIPQTVISRHALNEFHQGCL